MTEIDYQRFKIQGEKGDMEEGFSIYWLALLCGCFGLLFYSIYLFSAQNEELFINHLRITIIIGIIGFPLLIPEMIFLLLLAVPCGLIIIIVFILILYNMKSRRYYEFLPKLSIGIGFVLMLLSITILLRPAHFEISPAASTSSFIISLYVLAVGISINRFSIKLKYKSLQKLQEERLKYYPYYCHPYYYPYHYNPVYRYPTHYPYLCPDCRSPIQYDYHIRHWVCNSCRKYIEE